LSSCFEKKTLQQSVMFPVWIITTNSNVVKLVHFATARWIHSGQMVYIICDT